MERKELVNMVMKELKNHHCDVCSSKMILVEKLEWVDSKLKGTISCVQCENWQAVKFNIYQVIDTKKPTSLF